MNVPRRQRFLLYGIAMIVLSMVYALYAHPDFMVQMVNQVWACF